MLDYDNLDILNLTGKYLVQLLAAVLNETEIPSLSSEITWEKVYNMAKAHSVEVIAYYGAKKYILKDTKLLDEWKKRKDQCIVQNIVQLEEQDRIFEKFREEGIRYLPLKGVELKNLYREAYFRQMSDLDILVDPENCEKVRNIMEALGYDTYQFGEKHNDGYSMYPYMNVEIHRQMLPEDVEQYTYYNNIWEKAISNPKIPQEYKLLPEDSYIYYLVHFAKHYNNLGSGIRSIMDIYLFLHVFQKDMNRSYIDGELKKLGLLEFANVMENLSYQWFSIKPHNISMLENKNLNKVQRNIFLSGIYGSREYIKARILDENKSKGKVRSRIEYIWKRIFMSKEEFGYAYPVTQKYPMLIPFFWIYRLFDVLFHKRKAIKREIELFMDNKN